MICEELLKKYGIDKDIYPYTDEEIYQTFLIQTDHIPNKIIEAQFLGESVSDYTEILNARALAREKLNELRR